MTVLVHEELAVGAGYHDNRAYVLLSSVQLLTLGHLLLQRMEESCVSRLSRSCTFDKFHARDCTVTPGRCHTTPSLRLWIEHSWPCIKGVETWRKSTYRADCTVSHKLPRGRLHPFPHHCVSSLLHKMGNGWDVNAFRTSQWSQFWRCWPGGHNWPAGAIIDLMINSYFPWRCILYLWSHQQFNFIWQKENLLGKTIVQSPVAKRQTVIHIEQ